MDDLDNTPPVGDLRFIKRKRQNYVNVEDLISTMHASADLLDEIEPEAKNLLHYFTTGIGDVLKKE